MQELHEEAKRYTEAAEAQVESGFRFQQLLLKFAMNSRAGNSSIEEFEAFQGIRSRLIHIQKALLDKAHTPFTKSLAECKDKLENVYTITLTTTHPNTHTQTNTHMHTHR